MKFKKMGKLNKFKGLSSLKKIKKFSYDLDKLVAINPYDFNDIIILEDKVLRKEDSNNIPKDALISTYIPAKYITTYEIQIAKNVIEKVDLYDYIETKSYEELELDEAEEYIFKYKIVNSITDDKNVSIEVIIVQEVELTTHFKPMFDKHRYIDYIGYSGFLFEVLYKNEILEPKKDIFVYFKKDVVLITLYNEGEFLQTILLNEGVESVYKRFKEDSSVEIGNLNDYAVFIDLIIKKGLDITNYTDYEEILFNELSETFSNIFMVIINQITSLQRKFSLPTIDRIFISTQYGPIPGMLEFTNVYLGGIESNDLKFDNEYNPDGIDIDQFLFLSMLSAQYAYKNEYQDFNFTLAKRPPTFFYRKSGQFISISVVALIISLLYPAYQYSYSVIKEHENQKLNTQLNKLSSHKRSFQKKLDTLNKSIKIIKQKINDDKFFIKSIEKIITTLSAQKNDYIPISSMLQNIAFYMKINNVFAKEIDFEEGILKLIVISNNDKYITSFVRNLVGKEHLIVKTRGIMKNGNSSYISIINIKVDL